MHLILGIDQGALGSLILPADFCQMAVGILQAFFRSRLGMIGFLDLFIQIGNGFILFF